MAAVKSDTGAENDPGVENDTGVKSEAGAESGAKPYRQPCNSTRSAQAVEESAIPQLAAHGSQCLAVTVRRQILSRAAMSRFAGTRVQSEIRL